MGLGKSVRLGRLFSHPSHNLCAVAVDHYIGYEQGMPQPLRRMRGTLAALVAGRPSAVTMHKGVATALWPEWAGVVPLVIQSILDRPDDSAWEQVAEVEEVALLGADAIATEAFLRGPTEAAHLKLVASIVRQAERYDLPVIAHMYPRVYGAASDRHGATLNIDVSQAAEDVAWAAHCALEVGADIVKLPYCGDQAAFRDIAAEIPLPMLVAGGSPRPRLADALAATGEAMAAGARGATVGRNIWEHAQPTAALLAFKAVIHEDKTAEQALAQAGL